MSWTRLFPCCNPQDQATSSTPCDYAHVEGNDRSAEDWSEPSFLHVNAYESAEERAVPDVVKSASPQKVIQRKLQPLPSPEQKPTFLVAEEGKDTHVVAHDGKGAVFCCCQSTSTYPFLPNRENRLGDPICDVFRVLLYPNRSLVCVADGCNWGAKPLAAAVAAVSGFTNYIKKYQMNAAATQDLAACMIRALAMAQHEIVKDKVDVFEAGTCTLLGGMIVQLQSPPGEVREGRRWGVVFTSVGDCKAYVCDPRGKTLVDLTSGTRYS